MKDAIVVILCFLIINSTIPLSVAIHCKEHIPESTDNIEYETSILYQNRKDMISKGEDVLSFHDGEAWDFSPGCSSPNFEVAIRFTPDELKNFNGWSLSAVRFQYWTNNNTFPIKIKIYDEGTDSSTGPLISREDLSISGKGWKRVNLSKPIELDATKDIWVSIEVFENSLYCPIRVDGDKSIPKKGAWARNWSGGNGQPIPYWRELSKLVPFIQFGNWMIEAVISPPTDLKVVRIRGGRGVTTVIKNIGLKAASDVEWGLSIFSTQQNKTYVELNSSILSIKPQRIKTIHSGRIFGSDVLVIIVHAKAFNSVIVGRVAFGLLIGSFVFILFRTPNIWEKVL